MGINSAVNNKFKVRFDEEDEDEEFPDFIDDEGAQRGEQEEGEEGSDQYYHGTRVNHSGVCSSTDAAVAVLSAEAREALEVQFEKTLLEYDDDEIGYLSEVRVCITLFFFENIQTV